MWSTYPQTLLEKKKTQVPSSCRVDTVLSPVLQRIMKKFLESESTLCLCLATQPSDFPLDEAQGQRRVREDMVLEDNVESVKCVHSISLQA